MRNVVLNHISSIGCCNPLGQTNPMLDSTTMLENGNLGFLYSFLPRFSQLQIGRWCGDRRCWGRDCGMGEIIWGEHISIQYDTIQYKTYNFNHLRSRCVFRLPQCCSEYGRILICFYTTAFLPTEVTVVL